MGEILTDFLAELERQEAAATTIRTYRIDVEQFTRWFEATSGEPFSLDAVTPTDVREYRGQLLNAESRAPATINRRLAALRRLYAWATAAGRAFQNPVAGVKGIQAATRAPKWLAKRDVDKLFRAVERHGTVRDLAIVSTLRHTGLRVAELAGLEVGDVLISARQGRLVVRSGKGGKYRQLPLNVDVRGAISAYLAVRPASTDRRLFLAVGGQGISTRAVELLVAKYARLAGLEEVTPHTLRHTFGKHALDAGADLVAVAALLGHSKLETTAIYTAPGAADLERAVGRLERDADLRYG